MAGEARPHPRESYWSHLYRAKWVILGITFVTFLLSHFGMLEHFETTGLDTFNILKTPADPTHVVIIGIDDDDYVSLFGETSPLWSGELQKILAAIAKGHPKVIGVDIDTSSPGDKEIETQKGWPPIVWGRDAIWNEKTQTFRLEPVLGGRDPARAVDSVGIAQFPPDWDWIIRRYHRHFPVEGGGREDSFPWAVVKAACPESNPMEGCDAVKIKESESLKRGRVLNFAGERFSFRPLSAHYVLQVGDQPGWETNSPIRDKIVLLGGYYRAARDEQLTPVGPMFGVQLMAQAIETEFAGGFRQMNEVLAVLLELLTGAALVYISYRYRLQLGKALLLSIVGLMILPLLSSYLAFSTLAYWFNFIPITVGVLLHELYEHGREYNRLRDKYLALEYTPTTGGPHDTAR